LLIGKYIPLGASLFLGIVVKMPLSEVYGGAFWETW